MDWLEIKEFFKDTFKYILLIVFILFLIMYIVTLTQVIGPSMSPNLNNNDIVILDKAIYKFKSIKRGDIISFSYEDTKYLIKRVIGLPGDHIEIAGGKVYVNNQELDEPYLAEGVKTEAKNARLTDFIVPEGYIFAIGDNREYSSDCRVFGCIPIEKVEGTVWIRFWPLNLFGEVK